jgi:hypothetical protein
MQQQRWTSGKGKRGSGKREKRKREKGEAGNGTHGITTCMPSVVWPFLKRRWHTVRRRWPAHQRPRQTGGRLWTEHLASRRCSSSSSNSSLGDAAEAVEERQREAGKRETGRAEAGKGKSGKGKSGKASARIALCLDCYNYRGGWRDYRGTVDSEPESEDAATGTARAARAASGSSSGVRRGAGHGGGGGPATGGNDRRLGRTATRAGGHEGGGGRCQGSCGDLRTRIIGPDRIDGPAGQVGRFLAAVEERQRE